MLSQLRRFLTTGKWLLHGVTDIGRSREFILRWLILNLVSKVVMDRLLLHRTSILLLLTGGRGHRVRSTCTTPTEWVVVHLLAQLFQLLLSLPFFLGTLLLLFQRDLLLPLI